MTLELLIADLLTWFFMWGTVSVAICIVADMMMPDPEYDFDWDKDDH